METQLRQICASALGREPEELDTSKSFLALGGDSLSALRIMAACEEIGLSIGVADVLRSSTISALWDQSMMARRDMFKEPKNTLTTAQQFYVQTRAYFISTTTIGADISPYDVFMALTAVVKRYTMLRAKLPSVGDFTYDTTNNTESALHFTLQEFTKSNPASFNFEEVLQAISSPKGPVFGGVLVTFDQKLSQLVLAGSRCFVDSSSWNNIIRDINTELRVTTHCDTREEQKDELKEAVYESISRLSFTALGEDSLCTESVSIEPEITAELLYGSCHDVLRTNAADVLGTAALLAVRDLPMFEKAGFIDLCITTASPETHAASQEIDCSDSLQNLESSLTSEVKVDTVDLLRTFKDVSRGYSSNGIEENAAIIVSEPKSVDETSNWTVVIDVSGILQTRQHDQTRTARTWSYQQPHRLSSERLIHINPYPDENDGISFEVSIRDRRGEISSGASFGHCLKESLKMVLSHLKLKSGQILPTLSDFQLNNISYKNLERFVETDLSQVVTLPVRDIIKVIPCSYMQQDLLTSQQIDPRKYQCAFTLKLSAKESGSLDGQKLASSWSEVVKRHETLRTVFIPDFTGLEGFVGVVLHEIEPDIQVWSGPGRRTKEPFASPEIVPFKPYTPPHRLYLIQSTQGEVHLRLDMSHVLMDGQSAEVILRDMYLAYNQELYPQDLVPYGEFVKYERELRNSTTSTYWADYLRDSEPTNVPTVAADLEHAGSFRFQFSIDKKNAAEVCATHGVTLSSICHLAWAIVLRLVTGSDTVLFSYVTSGRDIPLRGIGNTVGAFVKSLVCRVNFSEQSHVSDLLQKVVSDFLESLPHQHLEMAGTSEGGTGSARKWGNTTISFQHKLVAADFGSKGIKVELEEVVNPVDVSIISLKHFPKDANIN